VVVTTSTNPTLEILAPEVGLDAMVRFEQKTKKIDAHCNQVVMQVFVGLEDIVQAQPSVPPPCFTLQNHVLFSQMAF
jgi:hypothetical protein